MQQRAREARRHSCEATCLRCNVINSFSVDSRLQNEGLEALELLLAKHFIESNSHSHLNAVNFFDKLSCMQPSPVPLSPSIKLKLIFPIRARVYISWRKINFYSY